MPDVGPNNPSSKGDDVPLPSNPDVPDDVAQPHVGGTPADRRTFLRQLSGDAVWTAGRIAGASAVLRRSLVAAGETAISAFETADKEVAEAPQEISPQSQMEIPGARLESRPEPAPGPPVVADATRQSPSVLDPGPDPVAALSPQQHAFLAEGRTAVLAVNDPSGHPLIAATPYGWDGARLSLPARDFTARTIDVDRDPRVSVLIEDPASGAWVAVSGVAALVYGVRVEPEVRQILAQHLDPAAVDARWEALRASGDQVVIVVRPTRFVWRQP